MRLGECALSRVSWGRRGRASSLPLCPPPGHYQRRPLPTHRAIQGWEGPGCPGDSSIHGGAQRCSRGLATAQTQAVGSPGQQREKVRAPVGGGSMPEVQGHLGLSSSTPRLTYGEHNGALDGEARPSGAGRKEAVASTSAGRWVRGLT